MNKLRTLIICLLLTVLLTACNANAPLLETLAVDFSTIESLVLTDEAGNSVTVTDAADFAELQNYKRQGKLPEERELETFDSSKRTLCTFNTSNEDEVAVYLFNTGEIVCFLGEGLDAEYYSFKTDGQPFDKAYVDKLFVKYA